MRGFLIVLCVATVVGLASASASAATATAYVATANGTEAFAVQDGEKGLYFNPQPDTEYNWYYPNGTTVDYTYNGTTAPRDGMKTFAATSVGYGATLDSISLELDYRPLGDTDTHGDGLIYQGYPNMNIAITNGNTFALWSPAGGGTVPFTYAAADDGWWHLTMDLSNLDGSVAYGKINESTNQTVLANGTTHTWNTLKTWTVAGFYNEQFHPTDGFGAWNQTLWSTLSTGDDPNTTGTNEYNNANPYGIHLFWGDTVGSMFGDFDNSYIGSLAERAYGKGGKEITNFVVGVGNTTYDMTFAAGATPASIPEPASVAIWSLMVLGFVAFGCSGRGRRRANAA